MRHRLAPALTILLITGLATPLAACGGGGGGDGNRTLSIPSDPTADGFVTDTAFVDINNEVSVGDTDGTFGNVSRGFYRFPLSGIPAGATLLSAELRIFQFEVVGTPYITHGGVIVAHVNLGAALDATDFAAAALQPGFGTISTDATLEYKALTVTQLVESDIAAARATSDFRLRFSLNSDADGGDDYASFNDGMSAPDTIPVLLVTYIEP